MTLTHVRAHTHTHTHSTDEEERMQQKAKLEDDLSIATERLEHLVKGEYLRATTAQRVFFGGGGGGKPRNIYPRNSYHRCNEPRPLVHAYT